ncbi:sodium/glucose cotransporter 4-like isoform X2 [Pollicipes pollicipes]|nr:sodium/glucose cotransporter 4-like isoform X2 [Pollicipes pollicipes]
MLGLVLGMVRFGIEFSYTVPPCGSGLEDLRPEWVKRAVFDIHFLHFGCILFLIVLIAVIIISLCTEPIPKECLHRLTFWSRHSTEPRAPLPCDVTEEAKTPPPTEPAPSGPPSLGRKLFNLICGVEERAGAPADASDPRRLMTDLERAKADADSLHEDPKQRVVVNVLALFTMAISLGMYVYYR